MSNTISNKTTHKLKILRRLLNGEKLTSLDVGKIMSNPNQYFSQLKKEGFIGDYKAPSSNVKIRYLLPSAYDKAIALLPSQKASKPTSLFEYVNDCANTLLNGSGEN